MLLKMGWKAGSGLGKNEQGRKDPVNVEEKQEQLGLGRMSSELEMARNATAERRMQEAEMEVRLDPERVAELRARWKKAAEKKEAIQVELKEVQSVFYCEVCKNTILRWWFFLFFSTFFSFLETENPFPLFSLLCILMCTRNPLTWRRSS